MTSPQPHDPDLHVSGGANGVDARYEDIATLAACSDDLARTLASITAECHGFLADPNLIASAVLDPVGAAKFEAVLLGALDGPHGLGAVALHHAERAIGLRAVAAGYQAVDEANAQLINGVRWAAGYAAGAALPLALPLLAGGAVLTGTVAMMVDPIDTIRAVSDPQRFLTNHPGIVDTVLGVSPGLISSLPGLSVTTVPGAAHLLGAFYPDGRAQVTDGGVDITPRAAKVPVGFGDLMDGLDYRNFLAHPGQPDQIDVRVVTQADGTKSYIVDIPGTKVWDMPGESLNPALNDLGTNVHVMGGDVTAREHGIAEALHRAGASSTDPVMLIGHSQGGMVAAQAAADTTTGTFNYNVTHVMTAGSPIANADIPSHVQVMAIENSHDITPHLDAADNPDRPNFTTVTFDMQNGDIGRNHSTGLAYLPAAHSLDASTDPSVLAYRHSAQGFLSTGNHTTVQANVYTMTRLP